jgi:hypothetical protein
VVIDRILENHFRLRTEVSGREEEGKESE